MTTTRKKNEMQEKQELLTLSEAAELLGVHTSTVSGYLARGVLKPRKRIGKRSYFSWSSVSRLAEKRKISGEDTQYALMIETRLKRRRKGQTGPTIPVIKSVPVKEQAKPRLEISLTPAHSVEYLLASKKIRKSVQQLIFDAAKLHLLDLRKAHNDGKPFEPPPAPVVEKKANGELPMTRETIRDFVRSELGPLLKEFLGDARKALVEKAVEEES